ncbi:hypothetical protein PT282_03880 [Bifidobacterium sp. ESL0763]|nr:hypothetical protein [Bifidobacterium sp. ESL0763]
MSELSIFVDESGEWSKLSEYYLITLVLHVQSSPIAEPIERHERRLRDSGLPDIPFHAGPLFNGHDDYGNMHLADRKRLFSAFFTLTRYLPFRYVTFAHRKSMFGDNKTRFEAQLKRDLANFFLSHLDEFQSYETIKIYYDNGQQIVTNALQSSIGYALSKEAVIYRDAQPKDYRGSCAFSPLGGPVCLVYCQYGSANSVVYVFNWLSSRISSHSVTTMLSSGARQLCCVTASDSLGNRSHCLSPSDRCRVCRRGPCPRPGREGRPALAATSCTNHQSSKCPHIHIPPTRRDKPGIPKFLITWEFQALPNPHEETREAAERTYGR